MKKIEHLEAEKKVAKIIKEFSDGLRDEKVVETIELNLNLRTKSCLIIEIN